MNLKTPNMILEIFTLKYQISIFTVILFFSCSNDDDCTKMVNIPQWDQNTGTFVDNFHEVPCGFDEPVGIYSE